MSTRESSWTQRLRKFVLATNKAAAQEEHVEPRESAPAFASSRGASSSPTAQETQTSVMKKGKVAFISGPIDTGPDKAYFHTHYVQPINDAIAAGHDFVIGPILSGVDADALEYLLNYHITPSRITIFMTIGEDNAWGKHFREKGVNVHVLEDRLATTQNRDAAMTAASDYDILRWRTDEEAKEFYGPLYRPGRVTNTERNWRRRRGLEG
ncbi:uncharacterized protein DSM5745_04453 [Aspergillus mulundensis]|uniref:Uncharacterized protein n=1 Tax=Aspergillus mulundensis TaxID=1810919 RepID=A0A3D8SCP8_9EURO|nr:Uncharacterized protein DSM5745_04453 [Aspergillus mulundensis]RDW84127.1 Uncharacterized protein DSM5745_04453 [Aspergillus mulundensis]